MAPGAPGAWGLAAWAAGVMASRPKTASAAVLRIVEISPLRPSRGRSLPDPYPAAAGREPAWSGRGGLELGLGDERRFLDPGLAQQRVELGAQGAVTGRDPVLIAEAQAPDAGAGLHLQHEVVVAGVALEEVAQLADH